MSFDLKRIRSQFPSLHISDNGKPRIFLDNPGGTQVAKQVVDRTNHYLLHNNANHGGAFRTSIDSDEVLHEAHAAMADMLNANSPDEIIFGANMTTLTFSVSRTLGRWLKPGDEIVVTRLDHDADITPWTMMAEDRGAVVRWVEVREEDCTLDMADFESQINERTKIVACGYASNAVGTINDIQNVIGMAHAVKALVFVDAVQYAPHGPIDVQKLDCDLLACSAYKFFGPHVGIMYGKYDLLDRLQAYKVRPADNTPPYKFETGTQNHEGLAGTLGAVEYLSWLGEEFGRGFKSQFNGMSGRRLKVHAGMAASLQYERLLSERLINGLSQIPNLKIWGITNLGQLDRRVPTVSFTLKGWAPRKIAEKLAEQNIFVWDGNYYALAIMERLKLQEGGGMVRVGAAHYNTVDEVDRLVEAVRGLR